MSARGSSAAVVGVGGWQCKGREKSRKPFAGPCAFIDGAARATGLAVNFVPVVAMVMAVAATKSLPSCVRLRSAAVGPQAARRQPTGALTLSRGQPTRRHSPDGYREGRTEVVEFKISPPNVCHELYDNYNI